MKSFFIEQKLTYFDFFLLYGVCRIAANYGGWWILLTIPAIIISAAVAAFVSQLPD